ncbi:MAG: hypothetical protein U1F43_12950 [Myxococcota bacterium]
MPVDVDGAFVVPSLGALQQKSTAFLGGLEGAIGALDLLADRYGIDLRSPEGLEQTGLEPAQGAVVWTAGGAFVIGVSVKDAKAFGARVDTRLVRGHGANMIGAAPDAWSAPRIYAGPIPPGAKDGLPAWRAAWGVTDDGIGLLALTGPSDDPAALYRRAAAEQGGLVKEPNGRLAKAKLAAGDGAIAWLVLRDVLPQVPDDLGMLKGIVEKVRSGLREWQGGIVAADDHLALRIAADFTGEGELPVDWARPTGAAAGLAKVLPKTTTALIRFRVNLDMVRRLPSFLRSQFLPDQIPGLEMLPIPALSDAIDLIDGDVGVALLGIAPDATLGHLTSLAAFRDKALETFRVALIARLHDPDAARRQFSDIAEQLRNNNWLVADIDPAKAAGWTGWTFVRGATTYSVLMDPEVMIFIIGPGEVDAFIAARAGRATTLAQFGAGFDQSVQEALGLAPAGSGTAFGVSLGFLRVTRELADKGVPPYFLKMLNKVRIVGLSIDGQPKRAAIALEVAL